MRISGAASPMARAIDSSAPVTMPGRAYGSTCERMTSHRVAPTP